MFRMTSAWLEGDFARDAAGRRYRYLALECDHDRAALVFSETRGLAELVPMVRGLALEIRARTGCGCALPAPDNWLGSPLEVDL